MSQYVFSRYSLGLAVCYSTSQVSVRGSVGLVREGHHLLIIEQNFPHICALSAYFKTHSFVWVRLNCMRRRACILTHCQCCQAPFVCPYFRSHHQSHSIMGTVCGHLVSNRIDWMSTWCPGTRSG